MVATRFVYIISSRLGSKFLRRYFMRELFFAGTFFADHEKKNTHTHTSIRNRKNLNATKRCVMRHCYQYPPCWKASGRLCVIHSASYYISPFLLTLPSPTNTQKYRYAKKCIKKNNYPLWHISFVLTQRCFHLFIEPAIFSSHQGSLSKWRPSESS